MRGGEAGIHQEQNIGQDGKEHVCSSLSLGEADSFKNPILKGTHPVASVQGKLLMTTHFRARHCPLPGPSLPTSGPSHPAGGSCAPSTWQGEQGSLGREHVTQNANEQPPGWGTLLLNTGKTHISD